MLHGSGYSRLYFLDRQTLLQISRLLYVHEATISRRLKRLVADLRKQLLHNLQSGGLSQRAAEEALGNGPRDIEINLRSLLQTSQSASFFDRKDKGSNRRIRFTMSEFLQSGASRRGSASQRLRRTRSASASATADARAPCRLPGLPYHRRAFPASGRGIARTATSTRSQAVVSVVGALSLAGGRQPSLRLWSSCTFRQCGNDQKQHETNTDGSF